MCGLWLLVAGPIARKCNWPSVTFQSVFQNPVTYVHYIYDMCQSYVIGLCIFMTVTFDLEHICHFVILIKMHLQQHTI